MTFEQWETPTKRHSDIKRYVEQFDRKEVERSLFFYGDPGTGKTSLAKIIVEKALDEGRKAMYKTVQDIVSYCKRCMDSSSVEVPEAYIDFLCNYNGLLVIDEVGRTKGGDWDKNQILFPLIDKRLDKYNIWISNYSLDQLAEHYDAAIASRMQTAKIIGFNGLEDWRGKRP